MLVRGHRGFTLIEIMVVLVIMTVFLSILVMGFSQMEQRRTAAQSDNLLIWLKYVADSAVFDGQVYGVDVADEQLTVLGYFNNQWLPATNIESFTINSAVAIEYQEEAATSLFNNQGVSDDKTVPEVAVFPDGSVEPAGKFIVSANDQPALAVYWNEDFALQSAVVK